MTETVDAARAQFAGMPFAERQARMDGNIVLTRSRQALVREMRECVDTYGLSTPTGMFIGGPAGTGKTALLESFIARAEDLQPEDDLHQPCLLVRVVDKASTKALAVAFLEALGDPNAHRGNGPYLLTRLKKLMRLKGVRVLAIDEFQHLYRPTHNHSELGTQQARDWLKEIIQDTGVVVLATGLWDRGMAFLSSDAQIMRRISRHRELKPWDARNRESVQEFVDFLHMYDLKLPLAEYSNLAAEYLPILEATGGIVDFVRALVMEAMRFAVLAGRERIGRSDLAQGYRVALSSMFAARGNPFAA